MKQYQILCHWVASLRQVFPGRTVRSALVWTYAARLMPLPDAVLDAHAPDAGEG